MNGFLNVNKPAGMSSAAVVGIIRRASGEKRVGHAGTLDPEAAGILPLMLGRATRLFDYLADKEKEYVTVAAFGTATDTQDFTGTVTETGDRYPTAEQVRSTLGALTGDIRQRPSMYSAIKVGGRRLYEMARKGVEAEVPERTVHVERIELLREMPDHGFELRITCGRGTYIRSICHDLGQLCGCPAHMRSLTRTRSGIFSLEGALTPEEAKALAAEGRLADYLLAPDAPLQGFPRTEVPDWMGKMVANGTKLPADRIPGPELPEGGVTRIYWRNQFWGMAERQENLLIWRCQIPPEETEAGNRA